MKKTLVFLIVFFLTAPFLFSGCSANRPEGYNQKAVDSRCIEIIGIVNDFKFDEIEEIASTRFDSSSTVTAQRVDETCRGNITKLGVLKTIDTVVTDVMKDDRGGYYTISIIIATHENDWTRYMILLDSELNLMEIDMV